MISWMQKHNKYLVWTIWIATIAFIGAGFVGWGSYDFGAKTQSVAKVGNIEIKQTKLNRIYSGLYNQYNQMLEGKLDEAKAKEMGLAQQAFSSLETQAKILNFAKDMGIIVSDKELVAKLGTIQGFLKEGKFNKEIYQNYLQSQRLKAKEFEEILKEEMLIEKTLLLLKSQAMPLEIDAVSAAINASDKLKYRVLLPSDLNYTADPTELKAFWETQKENYLSDKHYNLSLLWTPSNQVEVTDEEIKNYYESNSFNYTDDSGKQLSFEEAKKTVSKDLKIKKIKKTAQKSYIAFKKGQIQESEKLSLRLGDPKLTKAIWKEIERKKESDILKPKVVGNQYVTVKINKIIQPKIMTFEEAKERITIDYENQEKKKALFALAESTLKELDKNNPIESDFVNLNKSDNLTPLNSQESLQFLQKLFTSNKEKGIISISDKVIVYHIVEQRLESDDNNNSNGIKNTVDQIKKRIFESNLLDILDKRYPTEVYVEGLRN